MFDFQNIVSTIAAPALVGARLVGQALAPALSPITSRLQQSGLLPLVGLGMGSTRNNPFSVRFSDGSGTNANDWKVRIRISESNPILYNSSGGVLDPLKETGGVIFPYTPQITTAYQANYTPQRFVHSNYAHYHYDNSEIQTIQIQAEFTAQNQQEANYVLACIYFFRAVTKMFFGEGKYAGNPPPIVFLTGYGKHYFPDVPCIVTSFSHTMPSEVDYILTSGQAGGIVVDESIGGVLSPSAALQGTSNTTRIPTASTFSIALQPVYSKESLTKFDLNDFGQGKLVDNKFI